MSKKFDIGKFKFSEVNRKSKHVQELTYSFKAKNGKTFDVSEVSDLYDSIMKDLKKEKLDKKTKTLVTVSNGMHNCWTIKGFRDKKLNLEEYDDYFDGKVQDTKKIDKIAEVRITLSYDR
jgi:hypothetical protein